MANGKKSFVLYCDIKHTVDHLTDEQAGILFKHIIDYVNDLDPQTDNLLIKLSFEPIKQQLKRDLKKWVGYIEKQRENGLKGGRPPVKQETQITQALISKPKKADNVNVSVDVNVSDSVEGSVYDAEKEISSNQIQFETICMKAKNSDIDFVKKSLRKYHLYLAENDKYPIKRKQIFAGFEKWLLNEKKINGQHTTSTVGKEIKFDRP